MTLREKLDRMRWHWAEHCQGLGDAPEIIALIDVALAVEIITESMFTEDIDKDLPGVGTALAKLDKALE